MQRVNLSEETKSRIVFRKFPWGMWILAFLSMMGFLYMLYHFTLGDTYGVLFGHEKEEKPFWTYIIITVLAILILIFLKIGKIDTLVIDK